MAKLCKYCGMKGHSTLLCWARPRARLRPMPMKKLGRIGSKWLRVRAQWFKDNPPDADGFYTCYICGDKLTLKETTLDHVLPRSKRPDLRFDPQNLKPCCLRCNREKGSKVLEGTSVSIQTRI